jgi:hypothetical protein
MLAVLVFSLKGWDKVAQGNALGTRSNNHMHPEGVRQFAVTIGLLSSPSGWITKQS